jgi:hypothetical protein
MDQPTAEKALARLEPLIGRWTMEAKPPDGDPWPGEAWVSFEWHESGAHLLQRWHVDMPQAPDGTAIIGCDGATGGYCQLYSDERGVCRIYEMSFGDGAWELRREGPPFTQRFRGTFTDDDTIVGRWEIDEDGQGLRTDFDVVYRRAR